MKHLRGAVRGEAKVLGLTEKERGLFAGKLMEHLAVAAFVLDAAGRVQIWNRACERLTGVPRIEMLGGADHWKALYSQQRPCLADLLLHGRLDEAKHLYEAWSDTDANPNGLSAENWCVMPRIGRRCYLAFDVGPIYDDNGELIAVVETLRDLTAHKEMETELENLAGRDPLTGIANRRTFDRKLEEEWRRASRHETPLSLLMIDVDNFKEYNDHYGHPQGDRRLRDVAACIQREALRAGDLVARIGGEEFAVLLPQTQNDGAFVVGEKIRASVEADRQPHRASTSGSYLTVSVGVATLRDAEGLEDFVAKADTALYAAKKTGRNRVVNFDDAFDVAGIDI
jgi:diguanylate cyclase (GGDEF)-like protein/PAS domain S-box-containing protein